MRIFLIFASLMFSCQLFSQSASRWRDSIDAVNSEIRRNGYHVVYQLKKASYYIELGQFEYAINECSDILLKSPHNLEALFKRAYAHTQLHHYDEAKKDYNTFLIVHPLHLEARLGLAFVFNKAGKRADALSQYNLLVEQHPSNGVVYAARACFEMENGSYEAALYDWDMAVGLDNSNNDYLLSKVSVLVKLNRDKEAKAALKELSKRGVPQNTLKEWYEEMAR